jgi:hypothetical protein
MRTLERRVHILLDEDRYQRISEIARRRRVSVATVIREAIDAMPSDPVRRRDAVTAILAADPMPVPRDPAALRQELDLAHERIA